MIELGKSFKERYFASYRYICGNVLGSMRYLWVIVLVLSGNVI